MRFIVRTITGALFLMVAGITSLHAQVQGASGGGIEPYRPSDDALPKQTLEGAHRFLAEVADKGGLGVEIPLRNGQYNLVEESRDKYDCVVDRKTGAQVCSPVAGVKEYYERILAPFRTENAVFAEVCLTQFNFTPNYFGTGDVPKDTMVDWRKVTRADSRGNVVSLSGVPIKFHLSSPELAARFAYTATFIQNACDPKKRTGF